MSQGRANCPDDLLGAVLEVASRDPEQALIEVSGLSDTYPEDARLHFLKGSLLAGDQKYDLAKQAVERATVLSPDFALAHFQLGFLHITSGDVSPAMDAWEGLAFLPESDALRLFARGLTALAHDDLILARASLEAGIAVNSENPPLNRDMSLILAEIAGPPAPSDEPVSSTHLLLQQYANRQTRH